MSEDSTWINGLPWMSKDRNSLPMRNVQEIKLNNNDIESMKRESLRPESILETVSEDVSEDYASDLDTTSFVSRKVDLQKVKERYEFSSYIIDPNKFRLRKIVRVLALVIRFIRKTGQKVDSRRGIESTHSVSGPIQIPGEINNEKYLLTTGNCYKTNRIELKCKLGLIVILTDHDIKFALEYFFKKSTLELKKFATKQSYKNITEDKEAILYYTGRILPSQEFGGNLSMTDVIVDLTARKFVVPVVDDLSPLAFSK